jgi:sarcosine oxidase
MNHALVVGAGVTGASVARELAGRGWAVTLAEQHSPGTVRSASGGDTRLLRAAHGGEDWYTRLAWRARSLWLDLQVETGVHIWEPVGLAWFAHRDDGFETTSIRVLEDAGIPYTWRRPAEAQALFPSLATGDLTGVLYEPDAGVLHARRATQLLVEDGERHGVRVESRRVVPDDEPDGDAVVWACGAWLPRLFPAEVEVRVERRDVFFLGGAPAWRGTPGWVDYDGGFYGHGDIGALGIKIAPDHPSPQVDPEALERLPLADNARSAQAFASRRFPALANAPIVGARVCQYDLSADTHFVFGRHPERSSWWLFGGGSGHGFKHGPALAEYVADCVEGSREPEPFHALGKRSGHAGLRTAA